MKYNTHYEPIPLPIKIENMLEYINRTTLGGGLTLQCYLTEYLYLKLGLLIIMPSKGSDSLHYPILEAQDYVARQPEEDKATLLKEKILERVDQQLTPDNYVANIHSIDEYADVRVLCLSTSVNSTRFGSVKEDLNFATQQQNIKHLNLAIKASTKSRTYGLVAFGLQNCTYLLSRHSYNHTLYVKTLCLYCLQVLNETKYKTNPDAQEIIQVLTDVINDNESQINGVYTEVKEKFKNLRFAELEKYRTEINVKEKIKNILTVDYSEAINQKQKRINNIRSDVNTYNERISNAYKEMKVIEIEKQGLIELQQKGIEDPQIIELQQYLESINAVHTYTVVESNLYLIVKGYSAGFDSSYAKRILNNGSHNIHKSQFGDGSVDVRDLLFKRLFIEQTIKLRLYTAVCISIKAPHLSTRFNDLKELAPENYMPNPHLSEYNCWGNNKNYILDALTNIDYIGAIEQIIAANSSFNIIDSTVFNRFVNNITTSGPYRDLKCFEYQDVVYSIEELIALFKQEIIELKEKKQEEQNNGEISTNGQ